MLSLRKLRRRKKTKDFELDINSLLDILVILLVFLIKNYSVTQVSFNIPKDIKLPVSQSFSPTVDAIIIQMAKDRKVFIDDKLVVDLNSLVNHYEENGVITAVKNELELKKAITQSLAQGVERMEKPKVIINLVMDSSLPYKFIRQLMNTSTVAGYKEFKFVVQQVGE